METQGHLNTADTQKGQVLLSLSQIPHIIRMNVPLELP